MRPPRWIEVERRTTVTPWIVFGVSLAAIIAALVVAGVFFKAYGVSPFRAYYLIITGALGSSVGLAETVRRTIPLLLIGVGLTVAFRALFWNIGAEGQLLAGAIAATGVALFVPMPEVLRLPAMFAAGFMGGAAWAFIPAILKVRLGINDVISTLMLNYVAAFFVQWLILGPWKGPTARGFAYTDKFPPSAMIARIPGTTVHWPTLILGVVAAVLAYVWVARTRQGFEIRVVGENPNAARYAGISQGKVIIAVMLVSGGLAGLAGVGEVAGVQRMLLDPAKLSLGYGYTAIIVAWLARRNPLAVLVTSFLFGVIMAGGDVIKVSLGLPFQLVNVFNGLILFFLIGSETFMKYKVSFVRRKC
jgi:ABC-type uncharacterized transport system permease subunit